jgi:hypothetical protein
MFAAVIGIVLGTVLAIAPFVPLALIVREACRK